jgi:hypothetical protein
MNGPLPERTKEQIVRTCRTTLGDELRRVRYARPGHRECLYERDDLSIDADVPLRIAMRDGERDPDIARDATLVDVVENDGECAVFVGRADDTVCRCDSESLTRFCEVGSAIATIVESE